MSQKANRLKGTSKVVNYCVKFKNNAQNLQNFQKFRVTIIRLDGFLTKMCEVFVGNPKEDFILRTIFTNISKKVFTIFTFFVNNLNMH
jgi:hypothetical protein